MLHFDKNTLDKCRKILAEIEPFSVQDIYDQLDELGIPESKTKALFHDLLPELVNWCDSLLSSKKGDDVYFRIDAIGYMMYLIEEEDLRALIPFTIRSIQNNKDNIKMSLGMHEIDGRSTGDALNNLQKFGFNWTVTGFDILNAMQLYPPNETNKADIIKWMLTRIKKENKLPKGVKTTAEYLIQSGVDWPELPIILRTNA